MEHISKAVPDIRAKIRNAEALSDELLSATGALKLKMLELRSHPKVEPAAAQAAFIRLQRAEQNIVDAASDLFRTHDELMKFAVRMDVEHPPTRPSGLSDDATVRHGKVVANGT